MTASAVVIVCSVIYSSWVLSKASVCQDGSMEVRMQVTEALFEGTDPLGSATRGFNFEWLIN